MYLFCRDGLDQLTGNKLDLRVNFDINGVVLGQETVEGKTTPYDEYANIMLANGTYSRWSKNSGNESYKEHVWNTLLPGENSDKELRKKRKAALRDFAKTLEEQNHPLAARIKSQYDQLVRVLQKSPPIFSGLGNAVRTLQEKGVKHSLVFRTFGEDGKHVLQYFKEDFPAVKFLSGSFDDKGVFSYNNEAGKVISLSTPDEFNKLMDEGSNWIIQDNFDKWRQGKEAGKFGKLFTIAPASKTVSVFLDDNLEIAASDNQRTIVCCYDASSKKYVSTKKASLHLHKVNPINAALDPDYLTKAVSQCAGRIILRRKIDSFTSLLSKCAAGAAIIFILGAVLKPFIS